MFCFSFESNKSLWFGFITSGFYYKKYFKNRVIYYANNVLGKKLTAEDFAKFRKLIGIKNDDDEKFKRDGSIVDFVRYNTEDNSEYQQYADVNLNGGIDIQDIILILQSVSGNYGTNLLYPEYSLKLYLNVPNDDGFDYSEFDDEYILHYSITGTILTDKESNIVLFDDIRTKMQSKG